MNEKMVTYKYTSEAPFQLGDLTLVDITEVRYDDENLPPTYNLFLESMNDEQIIAVTMEVSFDYITKHGIEIYESGVPLDEIVN